MREEKLPPIHPGEILKEEFLDAMGMTEYRLSRLGRYFGIAPQFWTNLQSHHDLEIQQDKLGPRGIRSKNIYESNLSFGDLPAFQILNPLQMRNISPRYQMPFPVFKFQRVYAGVQD